MIGESVIPGDRPLSMDELRLIQDMARAGRPADEIAARLGNVDPNRIAAMIAPKRHVPKKQWKGRR